MKIILEKEELEMVAELKGCFMGLRALFKLRDMNRMDDRELLEKVKRSCEHADEVIAKLKKVEL